jgi:hypothetical protein
MGTAAAATPGEPALLMILDDAELHRPAHMLLLLCPCAVQCFSSFEGWLIRRETEGRLPGRPTGEGGGDGSSEGQPLDDPAGSAHHKGADCSAGCHPLEQASTAAPSCAYFSSCMHGQGNPLGAGKQPCDGTCSDDCSFADGAPHPCSNQMRLPGMKLVMNSEWGVELQGPTSSLTALDALVAAVFLRCMASADTTDVDAGPVRWDRPGEPPQARLPAPDDKRAPQPAVCAARCTAPNADQVRPWTHHVSLDHKRMQNIVVFVCTNLYATCLRSAMWCNMP